MKLHERTIFVSERFEGTVNVMSILTFMHSIPLRYGRTRNKNVRSDLTLTVFTVEWIVR